MDRNNKIKVAITHGDINGVGYEVILKTFAEPQILELCTPIIYGSSKVAAYHRKALELAPIEFNNITEASQALADKVNIINCVSEETKVELGKATPQSGEAAYIALETAAAHLEQGEVDVLLTAPINKHCIQSESFDFPGHTEYLERRLGKGKKSLMILLNDTIRVALVTGHIPLSQVVSTLTKGDIVQKLRVFNYSLKQDFNIRKPRIAVLSLNPHAGEDGLLGSEEAEIIAPAMAEANELGILCFGPYAADGFFGSGQYTKFDGVLAMYHDQGLAPFKALAMESGVNYTAGLPIIRTSPAHGTAYDIAGKGLASEESFRSALYLAIDLFRNRTEFRELKANPLRKQYFERGGDNEVLDLTAEEKEE